MSYESYERSYQHNPSISKQVIGYVENNTTDLVSELEFPILEWSVIPYAYLHKKGYVITRYTPLGPSPTTQFEVYYTMFYEKNGR